MRTPTAEERAKERAFFWTNLADVLAVILLFLAAFLGGSLTMLGEGVRGGLLTLIQFYSFWVLYCVHRDKFARYEFGVGKIEQLVWVVVGMGLLFGAFWVASSVVDTVFYTHHAASPLGLTAAAITNAINLAINTAGWYAMWAVARGDTSGVYAAQLRSRFVMLSISVVLQVTLTVAAVARDAQIALMLDATGATIVVILKISMGLGMIGRGLPDLLDAPASEDVRKLIRTTVEGFLPERDILAVRTRRSGSRTFAEVAVADRAFPSLDHLHACSAAIEETLRRQTDGIEVALVIRPTSENP